MTFFFFFFNDTATTEIYTLSLHDALPISQPRRRLGLLGRRELDGPAQPDDPRDVFRSRPDAVLLSASVDDRFHRPAVAHDEGADSLRRADLVPRDGGQRAARVAERQGHLAERLH